MSRKSLWAVLIALLIHAGAAFSQTGTTLAWGVNAEGQVWRWTGADWAPVPAPANMKQVAAGGDGSIWGINRAGNIFRQVGGQWQPAPGALTQVRWGPHRASGVSTRTRTSTGGMGRNGARSPAS